jgi:hypothetical protein
MVAIMGAAHVRWSSWYVLRDEPNVRNMGLFGPDGGAKPAASAFGLAERILLPLGDPVRIDTGHSDAFVYRYAPNTYVMWGSPQRVVLTGAPHVLDAQGHVAPAPSALSDEPVVVEGKFGIQFGPDPVVADSLYQFGATPWSYFARSSDGVMRPLSMIDWEWTSYMGAHGLKPLMINAEGVVPAGGHDHPVAAIERYIAAKAEMLNVVADVSVAPQSQGVAVSILRNGAQIFSQPVTSKLALPPLHVSLRAADTLDFVFTPLGASPAGAKVHIRLIEAG